MAGRLHLRLQLLAKLPAPAGSSSAPGGAWCGGGARHAAPGHSRMLGAAAAPAGAVNVPSPLAALFGLKRGSAACAQSPALREDGTDRALQGLELAAALAGLRAGDARLAARVGDLAARAAAAGQILQGYGFRVHRVGGAGAKGGGLLGRRPFREPAGLFPDGSCGTAVGVGAGGACSPQTPAGVRQGGGIDFEGFYPLVGPPGAPRKPRARRGPHLVGSPAKRRLDFGQAAAWDLRQQP